MARFTMSETIAATPERVFEVATDLDRAAERIRGIRKIERLTEGPVGKGTRFRETRVMLGKEATEELEVTAFDAGRSYTVECESCGCHYSTIFRLTPEGSGTRLDVEFEAKPMTFAAKLMAPLGSLMSGTIRKCFAEDLADLKAAAEGQAGPAGEAGASS